MAPWESREQACQLQFRIQTHRETTTPEGKADNSFSILRRGYCSGVCAVDNLVGTRATAVVGASGAMCSVAVEAAVLQVHHFDISGLGASCTDKPDVNCGLWQLRLQLAG